MKKASTRVIGYSKKKDCDIIPSTKAKQRIVLRRLADTARAEFAANPTPGLFFVYTQASRMLRHMYNRRINERATPTAHPITKEIRDSVIAMWRTNPDIGQRELAIAHGIDQGRVNAILIGVRV